MILERINMERSRLSLRQRMVADYILSDYGEAAFLTSAKLAEASKVSEATVIRFSNHMGYARYSEMQKDLRALMRGKLSQMDRFQRSGDLKNQSSTMKTVIRSMRTDIHSIEQTLVSIPEQQIETVVNWISTARRVYVAGTHSEYGIACYFANTLGWIRENVFLLDESHTPSFDSIADARDTDLIISLSFPPYPAATVRFLEAGIKRGANSVAITDSPLSPLAKRAKVSLYAHDEKLFFADNSAATVSLLSVILALVSSQNFERSSVYLYNKQRYWEELEFYHQEKK